MKETETFSGELWFLTKREYVNIMRNFLIGFICKYLRTRIHHKTPHVSFNFLTSNLTSWHLKNKNCQWIIISKDLFQTWRLLPEDAALRRLCGTQLRIFSIDLSLFSAEGGIPIKNQFNRHLHSKKQRAINNILNRVRSIIKDSHDGILHFVLFCCWTLCIL
jgi:hypothetical protein